MNNETYTGKHESGELSEPNEAYEPQHLQLSEEDATKTFQKLLNVLDTQNPDSQEPENSADLDLNLNRRTGFDLLDLNDTQKERAKANASSYNAAARHKAFILALYPDIESKFSESTLLNSPDAVSIAEIDHPLQPGETPQEIGEAILYRDLHKMMSLLDKGVFASNENVTSNPNDLAIANSDEATFSHYAKGANFELRSGADHPEGFTDEQIKAAHTKAQKIMDPLRYYKPLEKVLPKLDTPEYLTPQDIADAEAVINQMNLDSNGLFFPDESAHNAPTTFIPTLFTRYRLEQIITKFRTAAAESANLRLRTVQKSSRF